jgi:hypothetical protein
VKQTQKSMLGALLLLLVAGGVVSVALWVNRDAQREEEKKEKEAKLFSFDKARVRRVRLEKAGKLVAEAVREGEGKPWALAQPVQADADQGNLDAIVAKLLELKQKKDLGADTDPKQPGLDEPRFKVEVALEDKSTEGLEVGADNPFDSSLYLRKLGEKTVRIVDGFHKAPFDKSAFDLRDKRVLHLDEGAEVRAFSVIGEEPYTLVKDAGAWRLTGPGNEIPEPADANTADRVVAALKGLRATGIAAESADAAALKKYGLDNRAKVVVELNQIAAAGAKDTYQRTLTIGQPAPEKGQLATKTYARRGDAPAVFEIDSQILKDLKKSWFELQDKTVARFDREQVRALEIESPGAAKIVVSRNKDAADGGAAEEKFAVEAPASGAAKRQKVSSALYALANLKAAAFAGDTPKSAAGLLKYGLDKPRIFSALGEGGKVLARIKIGGAAKDDKRVYALAEGGERVVEVEKAAVNELPKTLDDVLEALPAAVDGGTPAVQASVPKPH